MAVDPSLMPLGQAKPAFQIEIVPNLIGFISTRKQARLEAAHHPGHLLVERIAVADEAIDQLLKLGLPLGAIALLGVQSLGDFLDLLDLFADQFLFGFDRVQALIDAVGQPTQLCFRGPPFFASRFRWIDCRTSFTPSAIRKPGGCSSPP